MTDYPEGTIEPMQQQFIVCIRLRVKPSANTLTTLSFAIREAVERNVVPVLQNQAEQAVCKDDKEHYLGVAQLWLDEQVETVECWSDRGADP